MQTGDRFDRGCRSAFLFLECGCGTFLRLWIVGYGMWTMRTREVSCGEQGLSFRLVILSVWGNLWKGRPITRHVRWCVPVSDRWALFCGLYPQNTFPQVTSDAKYDQRLTPKPLLPTGHLTLTFPETNPSPGKNIKKSSTNDDRLNTLRYSIFLLLRSFE